MRRKLSIVGIAAAMSWLALVAEAYILPAEAILSSVSKRRAATGLKTLVAEGRLTVGPGAPHRIWDGLVVGEAHRREHQLEGGAEIETTIAGRRWRYRLGDPPGRPKPVPKELILTFLGTAEPDPQGARGLRFLARLGIDPQVVSLSRQEQRIVFVIGAKPWEPEKPQLWIDKELRVPVRLITRDAAGNRFEQRLLGLGSAITGEWYPRRIETYENGELSTRVTFDSIKLNQPVDRELFEPPSS